MKKNRFHHCYCVLVYDKDLCVTSRSWSLECSFKSIGRAIECACLILDRHFPVVLTEVYRVSYLESKFDTNSVWELVRSFDSYELYPNFHLLENYDG